MVTERLPPNSESLIIPKDEAQQGEQFLKFRLEKDLVGLLPVTQLAEIVTVPCPSVAPVPGMPPWVMGAYNWRGEILWTLDLGHFLGINPWYEQQNLRDIHSLVVLSTLVSGKPEGVPLAVALKVKHVEGIQYFDPGTIQSPPASAVTPKLAPFLRGYWLDSDSEMLAVLDGSAILDRLSGVNTMATA